MPPNANAAGFRNNNARIKNIDVVAAMLINVVEKNPYGGYPPYWQNGKSRSPSRM